MATNGNQDTKPEPQPLQNAWQAPGPAAFDFRSPSPLPTFPSLPTTLANPPTTGDVVTTPTLSMLSAITHTTLLDDVFGEDATTTSLESHLSTLSTHAAGLFTVSGTMANQLALRTHLLQPPHSILTDHRAHILDWEAGGAASLSGAM
ncbi:MAG: hypothetical protein M1830_004635, partial [Pleopsidium flavum]